VRKEEARAKSDTGCTKCKECGNLRAGRYAAGTYDGGLREGSEDGGKEDEEGWSRAATMSPSFDA
jgi:hypothetical protein